MDNNNIEQLKDNIREYIKQNGNKEITGQILQDVLLGMVDGLVGNDSVANPEGEAAEILEKIGIAGNKYSIPQGTEVEANPTGDATETLGKIKIGEGIYEIQEGIPSDMTFDKKLQTQANINNQESSESGRLGYVVLQPEKSGDATTSFAAQIANKPNTIFEIRDAFDLNNGSVTIPANCVLKFNGGMLKNGEIATNNCFISSDKKCFDDTITFSSGSKIANVSAKLSWFCNNNGSADYGLANAGAISNDVFVDLEKVTLSHPITYTVSKRIRGIEGKQTTSIIVATSDFAQGDAVANALIIFDINAQTNDGVFDLAFDGNFKAKYGVFFYKYASKVNRCAFKYFVLSAIFIGGSEDTDIAYNHISYCGCGVYATTYNPVGDNLIAWDTQNVPQGRGNLTQLRIHHNYIVYTNFGILANIVQTCSAITNNCISESSAYGFMINANRDVLFADNYIESSGISNFWVEEGMTLNELYQQTQSNTMCSHLSNEHSDIFGITMEGWGIPFTKNSVDLKIRPSVIIRVAFCTVRVVGNGWSTNHIRTGINDVDIVNDDTIRGIDTVLAVGGDTGEVIIENNRIVFENSSPKYLVTGMNKFFTGNTDLSMPKLKINDNIGYFNKYEYIYAVPDLSTSFGCKKSLEVIKNANIVANKPISIINACGAYSNYPKNNTATLNALSKNLYNIAGGDTMYIENIPMFMLPKVGGYSLVARGVDFLLHKPSYNFFVSLRVYNDENTDKVVHVRLRNLNDSANPDNLITLNNLSVPSKSHIDVSFIVGHIDLHDYSVITVIDNENSSGQTPPQSYSNIYISAPYITPIDGSLDVDLSTDKTDSDGVLVIGSTSERPVGIHQAFHYYDTDLQKEIVFNGTDWTNIDGSSLTIYTIDKSSVASGVSVENTATTAERGSTYITRVSSPTGLKVSGITVKMGGIDISQIAYLESQETIYIGNVTGDIVIEGGTLNPSYLTFEAREANSTITMTADADAPAISLEYSPNNGATWLPFIVGTTVVTLTNIGDKAVFRGTNTKTSVLVSGTPKVNTFVMTGSIASSGDVTSLLNGAGGVFDFSENGAFNDLFRNCTSLVSAPMLPFGAVTANCLSNLFAGCSNIEGSIHVESSSVLSNAASFNSMFNGCSKVNAYIFDNINKSGYIFSNNNSCDTLVIKNPTPQELLNTTLNGLPNTTCTLYVPYSEDHSILAAYKTTGEWKNWYDAAMLTSRTTEAIQELDENGEIPI